MTDTDPEVQEVKTANLCKEGTLVTKTNGNYEDEGAEETEDPKEQTQTNGVPNEKNSIAHLELQSFPVSFSDEIRQQLCVMVKRFSMFILANADIFTFTG